MNTISSLRIILICGLLSPLGANHEQRPGMAQPPAGYQPQQGFQPQRQPSMQMDPQMINTPQDIALLGVRQDPNGFDAPGITNPFSIRSLMDNASSKVSPQELQGLKISVQAYVDGNLGDARKYFTQVTEQFPEGIASDRAYLGLAKIERAFGAYDVSRRILEAVIRKNRDYESIMLARRSYRDLQQEVFHASNASRDEMENVYSMYQQTSWWSIFSKIKSYNAYKTSKTNYESLLISSKQFDPIFSMTNITTPIPTANQAVEQAPVAPPSTQPQPPAQSSGAESVQEAFATVLPQTIKPPTYIPAQSAGVVAQIPEPVTQVEPTQPETPAVITTAPAASSKKPISELGLDEARESYLRLYEELKQALRGDDLELKRKLQEEYRRTLLRYNQLRGK
jgi:hypothetical protein